MTFHIRPECRFKLELQFMVSWLPWSYWTYSEAFVAVVVYLFKTLSSMRAEPLNRLKQPGEQRTEPNTCSAVFWSQCPTAYSNFWYHTIGPLEEGNCIRGWFQAPYHTKSVLFFVCSKMFSTLLRLNLILRLHLFVHYFYSDVVNTFLYNYVSAGLIFGFQFM